MTPLDEGSASRRDLYPTTLTKDRHPCPRRDSNPQSQQASGRRPSPQTVRPLRLVVCTNERICCPNGTTSTLFWLRISFVFGVDIFCAFIYFPLRTVNTKQYVIRSNKHTPIKAGIAALLADTFFRKRKKLKSSLALCDNRRLFSSLDSIRVNLDLLQQNWKIQLSPIRCSTFYIRFTITPSSNVILLLEL